MTIPSRGHLLFFLLLPNSRQPYRLCTRTTSEDSWEQRTNSRGPIVPIEKCPRTLWPYKPTVLKHQKWWDILKFSHNRRKNKNKTWHVQTWELGMYPLYGKVQFNTAIEKIIFCQFINFRILWKWSFIPSKHIRLLFQWRTAGRFLRFFFFFFFKA